MAAAEICGVCSKPLEDSDSTLKCDLCAKELHSKCCEISNTKLKSLLAVRDMVTWICPSCTKMNPMEKLNLILQGQITLEKKVDVLSKEVAEMKAAKTTQVVNLPEIFHEFDDRNYKKSNLVISGLPDGNWDKAQFSSLFVKELATNTQVADIDKIVIIRPKQASAKNMIIVRFSSLAARDAVLKNAKNLRKATNPDFRGVFINPDYTVSQRKELKVLRDEQKHKRAEGQEFIIRGFKLIPKTGKSSA